MVSHTFATRLIPSSLNISPCWPHLVAFRLFLREYPATCCFITSSQARTCERSPSRGKIPIGIARTIRSISGMRWPESCATPIGPSIMWMRLGIGGMGSARFCHALRLLNNDFSQFYWGDIEELGGNQRDMCMYRIQIKNVYMHSQSEHFHRLGFRGHLSFRYVTPTVFASRRMAAKSSQAFHCTFGFLGSQRTMEIYRPGKFYEHFVGFVGLKQRCSDTQIGLCCNACRPTFARIQSLGCIHFWSLIEIISQKSSEMMTPLNIKGYQDTREKKNDGTCVSIKFYY